jgi:hypothetical protein
MLRFAVYETGLHELISGKNDVTAIGECFLVCLK